MLENEVISRLLYKEDEIHKIEFNPHWVFLKRNKEIAFALVENDGKKIDLTLFLEHIRNVNPHTEVDDNYLDGLRIDGFGVDDVIGKSKALKYAYYKIRLEKASRHFADTPSQENMVVMQDALMELDKLEIPEDDGTLEKTMDEIYRQLEEGTGEGIMTYSGVDDVLGGGIHGGNLITIGARPGVGKTAYGINLACQAISRNEGVLIDFFTLEMNKGQMIKRFLSRLTEINSYKLRNPKLSLSEKEKALIVAKSQELLQSHLRIFDGMYTLRKILQQIRRGHYKAKGRPYVAFIDYVGLVEASGNKENRSLQVGEITRKLKQLTNDLDIPIIIFSQLNRDVENRSSPKPTLADLRESGSVEQDSSIVMFLHRDSDDENVTIVDVAKNREGYTGELKYHFLKSKMYFQELRE